MSNNPFAGPTGSQLTNNPFALQSDPSHASNRFPKIDDPSILTGQLGAGDPNFGGGQWGQGSFGGGYNPLQQQPVYPQQTGFPQTGQYFGNGQQPSYALGSEPQYFNTFGQQFPSQIPDNRSGALSHASDPTYQSIAAFDPYANLALLPQALPAPAPKPPSSPTSESFGGTSFHSDHPRSFVRDHKNELERWDPSAWKQFMSSIEKLKGAWEARKDLVNRATAGYNQQWTQQDVTRAQDLLREADSNIDLVLAAKLQLEEVQSGYRHSSDTASRSRVRQALNAGLRSLPEWPEELQTSAGVTVAYTNPQPQQSSILAQPTGYVTGGGNQPGGFGSLYQQQQQLQQIGWQQPQQYGYGSGFGQPSLQQGFYRGY
ncbi:uncharacterized protein EI90DRAFT_3285080 [Cantharellus anzutake]|uniref:uncharacterized protein n=1 Tax=Cantharellus anzutake TaxID=1750568 RepID=UPI0019057662|nr:uncharacterized protein EI90DRAFT_3285080 [Cantharellus anzutake]KAF8343053.1 hypothetical protein EI90DRAFT_3285080 [Cantharellus anzutake]